MNSYISDKFKMISFLLIIGVVHGHMPYSEAEVYPTAQFIQIFFNRYFGFFYIPIFYIISGYLYFANVKFEDPDGIKSIFTKIKKRAKSLLIPYILCNIVYLLITLAADLVPPLAAVNNNHVYEYICTHNLLENFEMIFIDPVAFHLWFIRDLLVVVALSPIFFYLLKYIPIISTIGFIFSFIFFSFLGEVGYAIIWFLIGGCLAVKKVDISFQSIPYVKVLAIILGLLFIAICALRTLNIDVGSFLAWAQPFFGAFSFWIIYDIFSKGKTFTQKKLWKSLCSYTFFIYLFHEPLLNAIKKLFPLFFGKGEVQYIIYYFIVPVFCVIIIVFIGHFLKKYIPKFYYLYTGGR